MEDHHGDDDDSTTAVAADAGDNLNDEIARRSDHLYPTGNSIQRPSDTTTTAILVDFQYPDGSPPSNNNSNAASILMVDNDNGVPTRTTAIIVNRDDDDHDDHRSITTTDPSKLGPHLLSSTGRENDGNNFYSSMSRQSTVSSIAGNSIDLGGADDIEEGTVEINLLLTADVNTNDDDDIPLRSSILLVDRMDEKSVRSDRPDPPPSSNMILEMNNDQQPTDNDTTTAPTTITTTPSTAHRHVTTAEFETIAVEALATLSTSMAEKTLSENGDMADDGWDLNRDALLAETPDGVSIRKTTTSVGHSMHTVGDTHNVAVDNNRNYHRSGSLTNIYNVPTTTINSIVGADHLIVLPRVDEGSRFYPIDSVSNSQQQQQPVMTSTENNDSIYGYNSNSINHKNNLNGTGSRQYHSPIPPPPPPAHAVPNNNMANNNNRTSGRRKIRFRLQEEIRNNNVNVGSKKRHTRSTSLLGTIRKSSTRMLRFGGNSNGSLFDGSGDDDLDISMPTKLYTVVDRGHLMIGWFDGTSSYELQQHIQKSVIRKLQLLMDTATVIDIEDLRILDESFDPPEDVVLSPYIPDGSQFLLRFGTVKASKTKSKSTLSRMESYDGTMTPMSIYSGRAPDSPSAAPSPHLDKYLLNGLNVNQLALLNSLNIPTQKPMNRRSSTMNKNQTDVQGQVTTTRRSSATNVESEPTDSNRAILPNETTRNNDDDNEEISKRVDLNGAQLESEISSDDDDDNGDDATMMLHSDDPIEARLREITNLLLLDRKKERHRGYDRQREKHQVVFVVANYFVLFLAIIAVSAELQARAPNWIKMMEEHLQNVQNCSENHEALFECVSRGDFAGLIASVVLWLSRSVATKRIFLFGFDTPKKLWTVVYESFITSVCWGISYLFIRRGMNPDTRPRFVQKYWKDAVYGSLAGFNAAFLKHILKNLIPEQVVEDALRERQLKIMGWLPSLNFR